MMSTTSLQSQQDTVILPPTETNMTSPKQPSVTCKRRTDLSLGGGNTRGCHGMRVDSGGATDNMIASPIEIERMKKRRLSCDISPDMSILDGLI